MSAQQGQPAADPFTRQGALDAIHRRRVQLAADTIRDREAVVDDSLASGDMCSVHDHLGAGERCADGQQAAGLVGPDHIACGVPWQGIVVELGDQSRGDRGSQWLAQAGLECPRQPPRAGRAET